MADNNQRREDAYKRASMNNMYDPKPLKEADRTDPLGVTKTVNKTADPYEPAKEATVRWVKFFRLLAEEFRLTPEQMLFAAELGALNILNAEDCPIKGSAKSKVRDEAFEYYRKSLQAL